MSLKSYRQKRDFNKTPEPKGKKLTTYRNKHLYVIQKHAASHLHYDFRLELNGTLLSWAIPKGPSTNSAIKRLAIQVEDHPIEYGSFEGTIPKGQYGGGTVMLWDKGKWFPDDDDPKSSYQKGHLTFTLKAEKLNGQWKLIRIDKENKTWLLIKVKDEYAKTSKDPDILKEKPNSVLTQKSIDEITNSYKNSHRKMILQKNKSQQPSYLSKINKFKGPIPGNIHPQLATLVDKPPVGKNWIHEIKFDGYRLIAWKKKGKTRLFTRNNHDWTNKFKSLAEEINNLPIENLILDGEVVSLDENQHSDFQLLQNAIKDNKDKFFYYVFDIIYCDQYNLVKLPLLERKKILEELISNQNNKFIRYSDHIIGSGKEILGKSCKLGLEGIVSKDATSFYSQKRDKKWLKTKCIKKQEFVIGGFNKPLNRKYFRSLMLGTFNKRGELVYHGNVGTGFTNTSLKNTYDLLLPLVTEKMPFSKKPLNSKDATWVKPVLLADIEYSEWTDAGILRHPSFKGLRIDKDARGVIKETAIPVENIVPTRNKSTKKQNPFRYKLTHPDKIFYPEGEITKREVAEYYSSIQQWILPHVINRPLTFLRCPDQYNQCFYQKHITQEESGLYEITIKEKENKNKYIYLKDDVGLLTLTQLDVLEIHVWGSRIDNIEYPDVMVFDLDPDFGVSWKRVVNAAFEVKKLLEEIKIKSFIKTTGGKGLHIVVPIKPEYEWSEIKNFAHIIATYMEGNNKKEYTSKITKSARGNKIFIDYLRNQRGATFVAPYSTRARQDAPVSTPIAWDELTHDIRDTLFTIKTLPSRLDTIKHDPWDGFFNLKQSLPLDTLP